MYTLVPQQAMALMEKVILLHLHPADNRSKITNRRRLPVYVGTPLLSRTNTIARNVRFDIRNGTAMLLLTQA